MTKILVLTISAILTTKTKICSIMVATKDTSNQILAIMETNSTRTTCLTNT